MIGIQKRTRLESLLPERSLIYLSGNKEVQRNRDVFYPFRQDSDFLVLTETSSPDLTLVGYKGESQMEWIIYSDPISEREKLWGTSRLSEEEIARISGIGDIRPYASLEDDLHILIEKTDALYVRPSESRFSGRESHPLDPLLKPLRIEKTPEEIENIRKAIAITQDAYDTIRTIIKPGMYEYEIEAEIARVFRSYHATEAYGTIVASGPNSTIIHYDRHTRKIEENDHILIDFGAEYRGYASDITRVFFVGEPSMKKKTLYDGLLQVKHFALSRIRPGITRLEYEGEIRLLMNDFLKKYGYIPYGTSKEEEDRLSRCYYPHSTSHFLGLDVHDVGDRDEIFQSGMVITCEPGIYIGEEGIGYRHEDDILITQTGYEVLSKNIAF